jgi:hypothetical protein
LIGEVTKLTTRNNLNRAAKVMPNALSFAAQKTFISTNIFNREKSLKGSM